MIFLVEFWTNYKFFWTLVAYFVWMENLKSYSRKWLVHPFVNLFKIFFTKWKINTCTCFLIDFDFPQRGAYIMSIDFEKDKLMWLVSNLIPYNLKNMSLCKLFLSFSSKEINMLYIMNRNYWNYKYLINSFRYSSNQFKTYHFRNATKI